MFDFKKLFQKKVSNTYRNEDSIPIEIVNSYNKTRIVKDKSLLCHAPFSNMYFNTEGDIALCWKTFHKAEKYDESKSILDIWNSDNFQKIRQNVQDETLSYACQACRKHLLENNFVNVLSKAYDIEVVDDEFPSIMEFELSNRCNLACTMCNGLLSSTIRRERENLPPLQSPYGDKFVEDLRPFIPHLKEARFNGGEPFSIKIYYQIWDLIFEINPNLKIVIATNGTILNNKVKNYLSKGNFHINLSIDGIHPQTYESIRIKGDFELLMKNFEYFHQYCQAGKRNLCIMINPMRDNWQEMPEFVEFCNEKDIHLWFNTIEKPTHLSLWNLSPKELENIYHYLTSYSFKSNPLMLSSIQKYNINTYENFVQQQIKTWKLEAIDREKKSKEEINLDINDTLIEICKKIDSEVLYEKVLIIMNFLEDINQKKRFLSSIIQSPTKEIILHLETLTTQEIYEKFQSYLNQRE